VTAIVSGATDMAWLVERSAEFKGELLDFGYSKRFARVLSDAVTARFGSVVVAEEEVFANFLLERRRAAAPAGRPRRVAWAASCHPASKAGPAGA